MIADFKKLNPRARIAQLFCEPKKEEPFIFQGLSDRYLQFDLKNLKRIVKTVALEAVHVEISTLFDNDAIGFCRENRIHIRTWALHERNPEKDDAARQNVLKVLALATKYPDLHFDIITDYVPLITRLLSSSL